MITNAKNSRPNGPSMRCQVSTLNVRIEIQSLSPGLYAAHQKATYPNFPQRLLSDIVQQYAAVLMRFRARDMALMRLSERYIEEKQTELETGNK